MIEAQVYRQGAPPETIDPGDMNFVHMPELDWKYGYPMALGAMLLLSAVLYRMFKKRDWL